MTTEAATDIVALPRRQWRWVEFLAIYIVAPVVVAWLVAEGRVSSRDMPTVFAFLFLLAVALLALTPGVGLRRLLRSHPLPAWRPALAYTVVMIAGVFLLTWLLAPWSLFGFPKRAPESWARVMVFYPLLSVIPQGIIYRALLFARYRDLFPSAIWAIVASAVAFSLAHLFFLNPVAIGLTVLGGLMFAWAHGVCGSFWFANLLHALSGWAIFTIGLGRYFYHGAI